MSAKTQTNQPPANKSQAPTAAKAATPQAPSDAGPSDAEKVAAYEKLVEENKRLKAAALDGAVGFNSLSGDLEQLDESAPIFGVQLPGNPRAFIRAANTGDARDIYAAWFNILSSEHSTSCERCDVLPEGENCIHVVTDEQGNKKVCQVNQEGELVLSEIA